MISPEVIYLSYISLVISPLSCHFCTTGTIISHCIILNSTVLSIFRTFQFVPFVIRQLVSVYILHHPYDTRLGRSFKCVAYDRKVIAALIFDAMVETYDNITSPATE